MTILFAFLLLPQASQATDTAVGPATAERPAITLQKTESLAADVFYLSIPWGPNTFATMESPGEGFYNRRSWPFARMETKRPLQLDGVPIPVGNHALVFHPNTADNAGMSLEVRQIEVTEFLQEGNALTRTPEGRTVWRAPVRFNTAEGTTPALRIEVLPQRNGFQLKVRYGDRWTVKEFSY